MKRTETLEYQSVGTSMDEVFTASGMDRARFESAWDELVELGIVGVRRGKLFVIPPESLHLLAGKTGHKTL